MRIYQHALPHVRRAMLLSWHLGLRPQGELLALTWDAVRWETSRILIISAAKGGPAAREVPVHPELMSALRRWHAQDKKQDHRHLVHYRGRRVKSIGRAWRKAVADAKIGRRVRPYDLRHYFITQALADGADLKALSEVVGSAPQTIVKFYQHVLGRQHEQTIALVKPLAPGRAPRKKRIG
jgi:integrase